MFGNNNSGIGAGIGKCLSIQPLKTCNITYNYQTTTGLTEVLPTSEPASPQITYTVTSEMFPTLTGDLPSSIDYVGFLLAGCSNGDSSTRKLYWRVKRNGTSIGNDATGTNISASQKGTLNFDSLVGTNKPVVGDVLEIYLWTDSGSSVQLVQQGFGINPAKFRPVNNSNKLIVNVSWTVFNGSVNNFTAIYVSPSPFRIYYSDTNLFSNNASASNIYGMFEHPTYGILTPAIDVSPANSVSTNASNYNANALYFVSQVKWQETNIIKRV